MEISIYVSRTFVNEITPIYKPISHEVIKIGKYDQERLILDERNPTTLKKLYEEGWILKEVSNHGRLYFMFFLEKN